MGSGDGSAAYLPGRQVLEAPAGQRRRGTPHAEPVEPAPELGSAHIHTLESVPPGAIAVDLEAEFEPVKSDEFKASGCVEVDSALLQDIVDNPEKYYVNIHNVQFPGGALFGLLSE